MAGSRYLAVVFDTRLRLCFALHMAERFTNGVIESLTEDGGIVLLDAGLQCSFQREDCYRDGTSFQFMRVGDRCRLDTEVTMILGKPHRGISAPNVYRWGQGHCLYTWDVHDG